MEPTPREQESVRVIGLLDEVGVDLFDKFRGRTWYGAPELLEEHTELLREFCENNDVTNYSLELQIWWRDWLEATRVRLARLAEKEAKENEIKTILQKLTGHEVEVLRKYLKWNNI